MATRSGRGRGWGPARLGTYARPASMYNWSICSFQPRSEVPRRHICMADRSFRRPSGRQPFSGIPTRHFRSDKVLRHVGRPPRGILTAHVGSSDKVTKAPESTPLDCAWTAGHQARHTSRNLTRPLMACELGNERQTGHLDQGRLTGIAHSQLAGGVVGGQRSIYLFRPRRRQNIGPAGRRARCVSGNSPCQAVSSWGMLVVVAGAWRQGVKPWSGERAGTRIRVSSGDTTAVWIALRLYPLLCYPVWVVEE